MQIENPEPAPDEETEDGAPSGRSIWSGTISFGLVSIPVTLRPAVRENRVALRMLDEDGTPLARRYYCPKDGKEVAPEHLIRGYEIEKDKYVIISDEELESLAPEKSRDIDLRLFVNAAEVEPIYLQRSYYLVADKQSNKAYRLLAETMERTKKVGIATFVMHDREHLVAIVAEKGVLRAALMRFFDETRHPDDLEISAHKKPGSSEVSKFQKSIRALTEAKLKQEELVNQANRKLRALIEKKQKEGKDVVEAATAEHAEGGKVADLMAELRKSLDRNRAETGADGAKSRAKRSGRAPAKTERTTKAHPLGDLNRDELLERARKLKIPGRSRMDKAALERAIKGES